MPRLVSKTAVRFRGSQIDSRFNMEFYLMSELSHHLQWFTDPIKRFGRKIRGGQSEDSGSTHTIAAFTLRSKCAQSNDWAAARPYTIEIPQPIPFECLP